MTATKILEIIVAGESIGKIKLHLNGRTTIVEGVGIISTGEWDMKPKEIKKIIHKRVSKKYIEIKEIEDIASYTSDKSFLGIPY